jgi:hypothetical protein
MACHLDDINWDVWYASLHPDVPAEVRESWSHPAAMVMERSKLKSLPIDEFYDMSLSLPWRLLHDEASQGDYYRALQEELSIRIPRGAEVAVAGPTAGRDMVAIYAAGGSPVLLHGSENSYWFDLVECRLMEIGIPFRTVSRKDRGIRHIHYVIGSAWDADPLNTVQFLSQVSGKYGYLLVSSTNLMSISSAASEGLYPVSVYNPDVAMFFRMSHSLRSCYV